MSDLTPLLFLLTSLILLVILAFLYRLSVSIGRLERRMEQLAHHLRDLNLYELHDEEEVLGRPTEFEEPFDPDGSSSDSTVAELDALTPPSEQKATPTSGAGPPPLLPNA